MAKWALRGASAGVKHLCALVSWVQVAGVCKIFGFHDFFYSVWKILALNAPFQKTAWLQDAAWSMRLFAALIFFCKALIQIRLMCSQASADALPAVSRHPLDSTSLQNCTVGRFGIFLAKPHTRTCRPMFQAHQNGILKKNVKCWMLLATAAHCYCLSHAACWPSLRHNA